MPTPEPTMQRESAPRKGKKYFTLAEATRALPLVKRIATDVQKTQTDRLRLHAELSTGIVELAPEKARKLQDELDRGTNRLETLVDELSRIGVELKDPARALLDFPAVYQGREILLCWKADEATISHWHEIDTGFAGRRDIAELSTEL